MKIAFVNDAAVCSGREDHMMDLAPWMRDHGRDPVFLIRPGSILQDRLEELNIRFHAVFDKGRRLSIPLRMGKAVLAERPDVNSINREHNILPVVYSTRIVSSRLPKKPKMVAVFHTPTGRPPRSLIPGVFHDLDLSVSTHRNEGFGIVHIESMACLTPVVA